MVVRWCDGGPHRRPSRVSFIREEAQVKIVDFVCSLSQLTAMAVQMVASSSAEVL